MKRIEWLLVVLVLILSLAVPYAALQAGPNAAAFAQVAQAHEGQHIVLIVDGTVVYDSAPEPVPTDVPTATATPRRATPTVEPGGEPTATPTEEPPVEHNTSQWHPPADGHHHGADPMTAHPDIVAFLQENPVFLSIGHPWLSSSMENLFPDGKHVGFTNLIETGIRCEDNFGASTDFCITDYYYQVHTTGIANEWRVRIHSHKGIFRVCNREQTQCDIVATGGWADYGQRHSSYKAEVCPFADNPMLPEPYHGDQPPYAAINRFRSSPWQMFWSNLHNPVTFQFYNPVPNRILQAAWKEIPWSVPAAGEGPECLDPAHDILTGGNATKFQVFTIRLDIERLPRPFVGFTDVYGAVDPNCTEAGPTCVPLYIGANVPAGNPQVNRSVSVGNPLAPVQDFDNGHPFVMPTHP